MFTLTCFAVHNEQLVAVGTLFGILTSPAGATTSVATMIALPVQVGMKADERVELGLGPLSVDLLGVDVTLRQVVVEIPAHAASSDAINDLCCVAAGLLDNPIALATALNRFLEAI